MLGGCRAAEPPPPPSQLSDALLKKESTYCAVGGSVHSPFFHAEAFRDESTLKCRLRCWELSRERAPSVGSLPAQGAAAGSLRSAALAGQTWAPRPPPSCCWAQGRALGATFGRGVWAPHCGTMELSGLEKSFWIIRSNHRPELLSPVTNPCPSVPRPRVSQIPPGMEDGGDPTASLGSPFPPHSLGL